MQLDYLLNIYGEDNVILNPRTREVHLLNQMALYILKNCDNKNLEQIAENIYEECLNKEELDLNMIINDCHMMLNTMLEKNLVKNLEGEI